VSERYLPFVRERDSSDTLIQVLLTSSNTQILYQLKKNTFIVVISSLVCLQHIFNWCFNRSIRNLIFIFPKEQLSILQMRVRVSYLNVTECFSMSRHALPAEDSSHLAFLDWLFRRVRLAQGYSRDGGLECIVCLI